MRRIGQNPLGDVIGQGRNRHQGIATQRGRNDRAIRHIQAMVNGWLARWTGKTAMRSVKNLPLGVDDAVHWIVGQGASAERVDRNHVVTKCRQPFVFAASSMGKSYPTL